MIDNGRSIYTFFSEGIGIESQKCSRFGMLTRANFVSLFLRISAVNVVSETGARLFLVRIHYEPTIPAA
jgi:hypothetical protein